MGVGGTEARRGRGHFRKLKSPPKEEHARWLLLRMGASVEVLGPPELRALMAESVAELRKMYG